MEISKIEAIPVDVLVVDDRDDNLMVMEAVLKEIPGCRIARATSGTAAIGLVEKMEFALILLDIQMPGLDGYETAQRIKQLPNGKDVPIMMVSAIYTEDPHILKGYLAGAVDYVPKPFNPEILKAKVGVYLNLYKKARALELVTLNEPAYPNDRRHGERRRSERIENKSII
jgi:CheY-like chemotaxis protein